jgi:LacI family transcriptional regulator
MNLTMRDIARLAGASPTAVSFVLNGKAEKRVRPATHEAILATIRKHGYHRRAAAKGLKLGRSFKVGLAVAGTLSGYPLIGAASHHELVNLAARSLHERGYGVGMLQLDPQRSPSDVLRDLEQEEVDGFLFVDFPAAFLERILSGLQARGIAAVSAGTPLPDEAGYSWAAIDREGSFQAGTDHLLDAGLRCVVMLDIDINGTFTRIKRRGYERAMTARGLEPLPLFALRSRTARAAHEAALELLRALPGVEGVLLTDNLFAPVVQLALSGRPCRLLGFGDMSVARLCDPPLLFMRLPVDALARLIVAHVLERIEIPDQSRPLRCMLPCELALAEALDPPPPRNP